ncbi:Sugar transporter ERD6 6 [Danaus plexippus plexippus]|uniref:Sugar transporter ERD6 6 n=1 Tax=Danaus plexippus plexippus TaxID=278856 RepID=A0A212F0M2_DANPL|nr:Sugar transporter ERD6 6 [Danaus plexippus plexippus]
MISLEKDFKRGHTYRQWIFALIANGIIFTYGMECGWISPTTKILQSEQSPVGEVVSVNVISWIASSMSLSAILGVSFYIFILDNYGRKLGLILIAIPQVISWIIRLCYSTTITLMISRVLAGLAAGGCFIVVPTYVKEISQDDIRGILGTFVALLQMSGVLFMYIIGAFLNYYTVIIITLAFTIVVTFLVLKAPESPAFLVKQKKYDEATETVAYLRGLDMDDKIVKHLVDSMKNEDDLCKSMPNVSFASILRKTSWRRGLFLIITIFSFHAMNGAYVISTYASQVLLSTGVKFKISPEIQTFSFPIFMVIGTLALASCVEKCGRKFLLFASFLIAALSMAVISILIILQGLGWRIPAWLPVLAIISTVTIYGAGISALPYIIMTEMFSFQIRAKVMGIVITLVWALTAFVVTTYTPLTNYIGPYAPFLFYTFINFLGAVFTFVYIPETRAKNEEEIEAILENRNNILNSQT